MPVNVQQPVVTTSRKLGRKVNRRTSIPEIPFIGSKPPIPRFPYGLKYLATYLPGGMKTMIHLAWLSRNKRVRDVARRWRALDKEQKRSIEIEELCHEAGVKDSDFIADIASTAHELGIDVGSLIGGMTQMPRSLAASFNAASLGEGLEQAWEAMEFFDRSVQRR